LHEALALDPRSLILNTNLGWVHYMGGRYAQALQEMTAVEQQNPSFSTAHHKLRPVAYLLGDQQRSWSELQAEMKINAAPATAQRIEHIYSREGYAAALKALVTSGDTNSYSNADEDALELVLAGDRDGAIRSLQQGLRNHDGWMVFVAADPAFIPLHKDLAYQQIVAEVRNASHEHPASAN